MSPIKLPKLQNEGATKSLDGRIQRRNAGSNHWYLIDGEKADGVTTILGGSIHKVDLVGWAAGAVGQFVYDSPEETVAMAQRMGRDAFVAAAKQIPNDDRDAAARRGTEVHKLAEMLGRGEEVTVPDALAGHVDAYLDFRDVHEPLAELFEVTVANLKYRFAGTLDSWGHLPHLKDLQAEFPGVGRRPICTCLADRDDDACLSLLDIKTSRSGVYAETGLQIAAYGGCEVYIDADGNVRDMPKISHYLSLWLRSDGWDLIPFDITERDFKTFLYCQQVSKFTDWKKGRSATIKGEALPLPRKAG
jgi:hypothetical protein